MASRDAAARVQRERQQQHTHDETQQQTARRVQPVRLDMESAAAEARNQDRTRRTRESFRAPEPAMRERLTATPTTASVKYRIPKGSISTL